MDHENEEEWNQNVDLLEDDYESFKTYFDKNRWCTCDIGVCKHFDEALDKVLGEKASLLLETGLKISVKKYANIL